MGAAKKRTRQNGGAGEKRAESKKKLVSQVIQKMEERLTSEDLKPTVADFIRLLQLERELEEEQPREIRVSWVEPENKDEQDNAPEK